MPPWTRRQETIPQHGSDKKEWEDNKKEITRREALFCHEEDIPWWPCTCNYDKKNTSEGSIHVPWIQFTDACVIGKKGKGSSSYQKIMKNKVK